MPEPFSPNSGLGMNDRVPAVLHRVFLDRDAVRHAVVGHVHRVRVAHVDLVLARPDLVVRVLDVDAELLEREHRLAAHVGAGVERREVEVAAVVEHLGRAVGVAEEVVLELGPDVERVEAHALGALERAPQDVARIALVRRALGREHVAEQARDALLLGAPRQDANVDGSGIAIMSDSSIALKPVIDDPSKPMPSVKAASSSERLIEKDFS